MVPLSLGRNPLPASSRGSFSGFLVPGRPRNLTTARQTELFALVIWLALFVFLAVGVALGYVWLRLKVVDLGYRLSATRQVVEKLENERRELSGRLAALEAPDRIEQAAHRLGMVR